jgi:hypothetical protein
MSEMHEATESAMEAHGSTNSAGEQPEVSQAQAVVKAFVRSLVKGRTLRVLATNGGMAECAQTSSRRCICFLDRKLTSLSLQRAGKEDAKKRAVPLEDISEIAVGAESGQEFGLATDEMCITLILESGQAIGFRFDDDEERDTFALCLSMFVDGRREEIEKRKERNAGLQAA